MRALRFLGAVEEQTNSHKESQEKGLMFLDANINGKVAKSVMIDTGTTHNFVSETEAGRLGLKIEKDVGHMKAVNSMALSTLGLSRGVPIKLGHWEGKTNLVIVPIDDFDVILLKCLSRFHVAICCCFCFAVCFGLLLREYPSGFF